MAGPKVTINRRNHLVAWLAWAVFYGLYMRFVASRAAFDWIDYLVFLTIHVGSFYGSVLVAFPWANPRWNQFNWRTACRLVLVILLEIVAIVLLLSLVSIALGGLEVDTQSDTPPEVHISNFPDVVVFLYSGLVFALFYLKFAKLQQERDELDVEVECLRVRLSEMENANLEQSLIPHLYANVLRMVNDAVRQRPGLSAYIVNMFNQLVRFYARLAPGELVSLADEVAACELYLEIAEITLGRRPAICFVVEDDVRQLMVIPMLVMLLVENLDKYAVLDDDRHPANIAIGRRMGHLVVIARNRVKELDGTPPPSTKKGLKSIKERLDARQLRYLLHSDIRNDRFSFVLLIDFE